MGRQGQSGPRANEAGEKGDSTGPVRFWVETAGSGRIPQDWTRRFEELGWVAAGQDEVYRAGDPLLFVTPCDCAVRGLRELHSRRGWSGPTCTTVVVEGSTALGLDDRLTLLGSGVCDIVDESNPEAVDRICARSMRWREIQAVLESELVAHNLVGKAPDWDATLRATVEAAMFSRLPILLIGEPGTGKELLARLVHGLARATPKSPLALLDCSALVPELAASELFGHERGAYTHAVDRRQGVLASANGGTLFLDEIGELPTSVQPHLLRAIQERSYKPVGSNTWKDSSFRLVCATNRDLVDEVARGTFRNDLHQRISGWTIRVPALRERRQDVMGLARHFLTEFLESEAPSVGPGLEQFLVQREYRGNIRELRHLIERLAARYVGTGRLGLADLPVGDRPTCAPHELPWCEGPLVQGLLRARSSQVGLKEVGRITEDLYVRLAVAEAEGNLRSAAESLGVTERALQQRRARWREELGQNGSPTAHSTLS